MVVLLMYLDFDVFGTGFVQVLYLGRAPRTKGTLPNFCEKRWVTRHSRVFRGLTGSQRTPGKWSVTNLPELNWLLGYQALVVQLSSSKLSC